ncbi:hypothetical protein Syun_029033 [Stephania yunnanensis]|uniref:RING-type domain-containing protein n=1 Tax=Stephania yunnanensis TaxID=152371 RepID=A0AAP0HGZ0_9MAGN
MATMVVSTSISSSDSDGSSGSMMPASSMVKEKGSRNKRKFRADLPIGASSSQMECASFEFSAEKSQIAQPQEKHAVCDFCKEHIHAYKPELRLACGTGSFEVGSSRPKEVLEVEDFQDADWSDLTENQLEELMLGNLDTIYKSAIKKIAACGYSAEVASKAVLRSGLCYGCKDTVSNIVDNTLAFLRTGQEIDASRDHLFENLEQLEKYVLAEMVCVLREVRPFFSVGDAMWCLLICDMNMSHACAMDGDPLNAFCNDETQGNTASLSAIPQLKAESDNGEPNLPNITQANISFTCHHNSSQLEPPAATGISNLSNSQNPLVLEGLPPQKVNQIPSFGSMEKSSAATSDRSSSTRQASVTDEKPAATRKSQSSTSRRESILRQKPHHLEKSYRAYGSRGNSRTNKVALLLEKKQKSISEASNADPKNPLRFGKRVGVDASPTDSSPSVPTNAVVSTQLKFNTEMVTTPTSLPAANTELSLSLPSKSDGASKVASPNLEAPNSNFSALVYDKTLGPWVPDEKKDEIISKLAPRVRELQNQLQGWTEWANQKVMQAARRLGKDKAELKTLKQEKEEALRLKKEKQPLEENSMKKLSEMENALHKAGVQVELANASVQRLQMEKIQLEKQMEVAKLQAAETAANFQEASKREMKTLKKFQSWEKQKAMFQEDLVMEKRKLVRLQQELEHAKELQDQLEARRKQEEKAKEEVLIQSKSIKKEREQIEATSKSKEDLIRSKADKDLNKYKEDIRKLETEISQLRLKADSSKIAALRWGSDGGYVTRSTDGKCAPAAKGANQNPAVSDIVPDFQDLWSGGLKRERECVMCLTDEMSVVFLPCAHQVVCTKCNELHEKQGMKDCPSCRTPIQSRICVRYARS